MNKYDSWEEVEEIEERYKWFIDSYSSLITSHIINDFTEEQLDLLIDGARRYIEGTCEDPFRYIPFYETLSEELKERLETFKPPV